MCGGMDGLFSDWQVGALRLQRATAPSADAWPVADSSSPSEALQPARHQRSALECCFAPGKHGAEGWKAL